MPRNKTKHKCQVCTAVGDTEAVAPSYFEHQGRRQTCLMHAANHCLGSKSMTVAEMEIHREDIYRTDLKRMKAKDSTHRKRSTPGLWTVPVLQKALQAKGFQLRALKRINNRKFFKRGGPAWRDNYLLICKTRYSTLHAVCLRGRDQLWCDSNDKHAHKFKKCTWNAFWAVRKAVKLDIQSMYRIHRIKKQ